MNVGHIQLGHAVAQLIYPQVIPPNKRVHAREIIGLFVPEQHRGKGEATRLLEAITEHADENELLLIIQADNAGLESFYKRLGFVTIQSDSVILMARQPICREALGVQDERQIISS